MDQRTVNVLLIAENERGWWQLTQHLKNLGCRSWFASTTVEAQALIARHPFRLILSARPVTRHSPLSRIADSDCSVFYSIPVEDGCLWFQAPLELLSTPRLTALRPREFMALLTDLVATASVSRSSEVEHICLKAIGSAVTH
jgi:hypothetical protein